MVCGRGVLPHLRVRPRAVRLERLDRARRSPWPSVTPGGSGLVSVFLLYPQVSLKGRVYRGRFCVFLVICVAAVPLLLTGKASAADPAVAASGLIISIAMYLGLALAFRSAASREHSPHTEKDRLVPQSR